jgi:DNA-binding NarL/FixJ family response regulator
MRYLLQDELAPAEIFEASSREIVLELMKSHSFDVVITSVFSGEGDCEIFLQQLLQRAPAGRLMLLSGIDDPSFIRRVLAAGAAGFVHKETPPDITVYAIRLVLAGGVYVPPSALSAELHGAAQTGPATAIPKGVSLTERQCAVLELLIKGASNKEIARSLHLSGSTVKTHVASLLRVYGVDNRTKLVHVTSGSNGLAGQEIAGSED